MDFDANELAPAAARRRVPEVWLEHRPQISRYHLPADRGIDGYPVSGRDQLSRAQARKKIGVNSAPGSLGCINQSIVRLRPIVSVPAGYRFIADKKESGPAFPRGSSGGDRLGLPLLRVTEPLDGVSQRETLAPVRQGRSILIRSHFGFVLAQRRTLQGGMPEAEARKARRPESCGGA
jgi:hypothetical protein